MGKSSPKIIDYPMMAFAIIYFDHFPPKFCFGKIMGVLERWSYYQETGKTHTQQVSGT